MAVFLRRSGANGLGVQVLTAMLYGQITSAFGVGEIVKTLEANRRKPIDNAQQPSGRTRRRFHNPLKTLSLGGYLMTSAPST
jgi:hypothetical protein